MLAAPAPPRQPTMKRHPDIELLSTATVFRGPIFEVRTERLRLPSGLEQELSIVVHGGAVAVAAELDDGRLLLVRQYRHAVGDWLLEVPAGRMDEGEPPLEAARRELEEETGHRAGRWDLLARFHPAPGFCSEQIALFHARDLSPVTGPGRPHDADEELELVRRTPAQILRGGVADGKTLLAALLLAPSPGNSPRIQT